MNRKWRMIINEDLERIWEKVVVTYFKIYRHLPGGTEENYDTQYR
jgi:hypothetical protein